MATLKGEFLLRVRSTYNAGADLSTLEDQFDIGWPAAFAFTNGTGDEKCDVIWHDSNSVTAGVPWDIDFRPLTFAGVSQDFATIKGLAIRNNTTTVASVISIGAHPTAPITTLFAGATDKVLVRAGGFFSVYTPLAGYTVTATTGDSLRITCASGTTTVEVYAIGTSS